jgi:hypothetical protein
VKARVLHLDSDEHGAVQAVLPWYANGILDEAERAEVEAHLGTAPAAAPTSSSSASCVRRPPPAAPQGDVDRGWLALRARLEAPAAGGDAPPCRRGAEARAPLVAARARTPGRVRGGADARRGLAVPATA